jgi:hypothetical protein
MVARHSFDAVSLKADDPEMYDRYARQTRSRTFTLL